MIGWLISIGIVIFIGISIFFIIKAEEKFGEDAVKTFFACFIMAIVLTVAIHKAILYLFGV